MPTVVVINPNSSAATTGMMADIVRADLSGALAGVLVEGRTASRAPAMITDPEALAASAAEVVEIGKRLVLEGGIAGLIVAAYGDPGLAGLRAAVDLPVIGIGESSMLEAGKDGRRFGVATTTPLLGPSIAGCAEALGLSGQFTGCRFTPGDPHALTADKEALERELEKAVLRCLNDDGAAAVIIGGGPLGQAALNLAKKLSAPVVAPLAAAACRMAALLCR